MGEAVRVHRRFGDRPRISARRRDEDVGLFEERRRPGALDEIGGEFAERQVLAPRLDEAEVATSQNAVDPPFPSTTS